MHSLSTGAVMHAPAQTSCPAVKAHLVVQDTGVANGRQQEVVWQKLQALGLDVVLRKVYGLCSSAGLCAQMCARQPHSSVAADAQLRTLRQ